MQGVSSIREPTVTLKPASSPSEAPVKEVYFVTGITYLGLKRELYSY